MFDAALADAPEARGSFYLSLVAHLGPERFDPRPLELGAFELAQLAAKLGTTEPTTERGLRRRDGARAFTSRTRTQPSRQARSA